MDSGRRAGVHRTRHRDPRVPYEARASATNVRRMSPVPTDPYAVRILEQLLRLRAAGALPLVESAPGRGIWRYGFRAAGQPVSIDLDTTVLCLRVYHARDEVAMGPVPEAVMDALLGRKPVPADVPKTPPADTLEELRRVVADWRDGNPRIYMQPPETVGHPDNWNGA
jgi:hypothetical protein